MALLNRFSRVILPAMLIGLVGCSSLESLFSGDEADKSSEATTTTTAATPARPAGSTTKAGEGAWRALVILDTSADHSFFAPEQAVVKALEGTDIRLARAWALGPVEVKNEAGEVLGTVDLAPVTDQPKGYVFVEDGRPSDFVSPASLPFVLQQASAYFGKPLKLANGRSAATAGVGGGVGGGMGARQMNGGGKAIGGPAGNGGAKRMKAGKGATGARKVGSRPAPGAEGASSGDASSGDATGE